MKLGFWYVNSSTMLFLVEVLDRGNNLTMVDS
jgi:hypothetical protein